MTCPVCKQETGIGAHLCNIVPEFDHFYQESRPINKQEWIDYMQKCMTKYRDDMKDAGIGEYAGWHEKEHTYQEWVNAFFTWMSF